MKRSTKYSVAGLGVTLVIGLASGYHSIHETHCNSVRERGAQLKLIAENNVDREIDATFDMLNLVDTNRDCFTKTELEKVELGRKILKGLSE